MEPDNSSVNGISNLKEFEDFIDSYSVSINIPDCAFDPIAQEALNLSHEEFIAMSSEEAQAYSYKLMQYSLFLRKELDRNRARLEWCNETINKNVAKTYAAYSEYMKYEIRKKSVSLNDTFISKVTDLKEKIWSTIIVVEDKIKDISVMCDIFRDYAKRKAFSER